MGAAGCVCFYVLFLLRIGSEMFPTLWFGVQTYAVTLAVGFLLGTYLAVHEGRRVGIARWAIIDVAFWCLILGMFGARAAFVVVGWETFVDACVAPGRVGFGPT